MFPRAGLKRASQRTHLVAACALCLMLLGGCWAHRDEPRIGDARVRAPIPGQDRTAGYFTVHNPTARSLVLVGARSAAARSIEMHTTERDGELMRMRRLDKVVVPPGDTVRFEPGGRHLMLFGVAPLGQTTEITLLREDGSPIPVDFETIPMGGA